MAKVELLFQGFNKLSDHFAIINKIANENKITKVIISSAFARKKGIKLLENFIIKNKDIIEFYLGIRNGVTSIQSIFKLIKYKVNIYLIDTGSINILFHPKIYLLCGDDKYFLIIGSANLTLGGLYSNVEASAFITLNNHEENDKLFIRDLINTFEIIKNKYTENIFKISSYKEAYQLFKKSLLVDERTLTNVIVGSNSKKNNQNLNRDKVKKIKLIHSSSIKDLIKEEKYVKPKKEVLENYWVLVWESKGLTERDLNIPHGRNTNPTGSMLFKKGNWQNIDQRHFFREEIFNELNWYSDNSKQHLERSAANFKIIIKGINYGNYVLKLTHDSRKDSKTYLQNNSMTQLHWGEVKKLIAKNDLLLRILKLYKSTINELNYLIEID